MFPLSLGRYVGRAVGAIVRFVQETFHDQPNPSPEQAFYETARDAATLLPTPAPFTLPAHLLFWGRLAQRVNTMNHPGDNFSPAGQHPLQRGVECLLQTAGPGNGILLQPIGLRSSFDACIAR